MATIAFSFTFILVSSLLTKPAAVRPVPLPPDSNMSLDDRGYKPIAGSPGGNAVSIAGSRSYIPGGDDTLADSKMSLNGFDHSMLPKKSLDYNPIVPSLGGNSVSIPGLVGSPGGNAVLAARFLPSSLPPSAYVVEREPPSKPPPPSCLPNC